MAQPPKRRLPQTFRDVPWKEFRQRASTVFLMLQAGWTVLSEAERDEAKRLITKSKGRPRNLTSAESRKLGRIAAKAARAATSQRRR